MTDPVNDTKATYRHERGGGGLLLLVSERESGLSLQQVRQDEEVVAGVRAGDVEVCGVRQREGVSRETVCSVLVCLKERDTVREIN